MSAAIDSFVCNEWGFFEEAARPLIGTARHLGPIQLDRKYTDRDLRVMSLYELSVPLRGHTFVRVYGHEGDGHASTWIYPSDADGAQHDFETLPGRFVGAVDHVRALRRAGFDLLLD